MLVGIWVCFNYVEHMNKAKIIVLGGLILIKCLYEHQCRLD